MFRHCGQPVGQHVRVQCLAKVAMLPLPRSNRVGDSRFGICSQKNMGKCGGSPARFLPAGQVHDPEFTSETEVSHVRNRCPASIT